MAHESKLNKETNMSKVRKILCGVTLAAVAGAAAPAVGALAQAVTPTEVGCDANGECWAIISPGLTASNCTGGNTILRFTTTDAGAQGQFRTATSALLAGKKIDVAFGGCTPGNFPKASFVGMIQ
jgi:hypothetical protein